MLITFYLHYYVVIQLTRTTVSLTFDEYLQHLGFPAGNNPFASVNARDERQVLEGYFVPPPYYESLWGDPSDPKSSIILAPTGGGKTALAVMIDERAQETLANPGDSRPVLTVLYDEFSRLGLAEDRHDVAAHFEALNYLLTVHIIAVVGEQLFPHLQVTSDERHLLRHAFAKYVGGKAPAEVYRDLEKIRTPLERVRATARKAVQAIPVISILAAALELGVEKLRAGMELTKLLANLEESTRSLNATAETDFHRLVDLATKYYQAVYILVDRVDETSWTQRDAEKTYRLVHPLVGNLALLDHPDRKYAFKFFLWDAVKPFYTDHARPDRIFTQDLVWTRDQLIQMINNRLYAFSRGAVKAIDELLAGDLSAADVMSAPEVLALFAGTSPRTMVTMCRFMVEEQLNLINQGDGTPVGITEVAFMAGLKKYATERAAMLIPDEKALREILSVKRVVFSSKTLNAELFRGNTPQSVQSKVGKWKRYGVFSVIASEVSGKRGFPTEIHAFTEPSVAYLAVDLPLRDFLLSKVRVCENCGAPMIRDFEKGGTFQCKECFTNIELPRIVTEAEERRQGAIRQLARELSKVVAAPEDIRALSQAANLGLGEDTFSGAPFLIWLRVLQSLAESDTAALAALLEAVADALPAGSKTHGTVIELYVAVTSEE